MLRQRATAAGLPPENRSRRRGCGKALTAVSLVALAGAVTATPAQAGGLSGRHRGSLDHLPDPAVYDWSGLYFGGHAIPPVDSDGVVAGGHLGFNQQFSHWAGGLEVSFSDGDLDGRQIGPVPDSLFREPDVSIAGATLTTRFDIDGLFLATARVGTTWDRWFAYVKAGYASTTITTSHFVSGTAIVEQQGHQFALPFEAEGRSSQRHHGWVLGAGLEYAVTPNIIFGLEYNLIDLGGEPHTALAEVEVNGHAGEAVHLSTTVDPDAVQTAWARLSFKFGCCAVPLK